MGLGPEAGFGLRRARAGLIRRGVPVGGKPASMAVGRLDFLAGASIVRAGAKTFAPRPRHIC